MFSRRVPQDLHPNRLTAARQRLGRIPFDLTVTNPTTCGLPYPEALLQPLADPAALRYRPNPLGDRGAREAVAATYAGLGVDVDPDRVVLSASTSEAYSWLFRLLADPGDSFLVPTPSYPLFEHLLRLDALHAAPYRLDPEARWQVDLGSLADAPATTRGLILVHPNNPTGSHVHPDDADHLARLAAERGWALVADEVFLPFPLRPWTGWDHTFAGRTDCLTFTLGGLSKSVGLPQMKLAWTVVSGPGHLVHEALARLEHIADAYLSVSTPTALAARRWLEAGATVREAISERCRGNLATLLALAERLPAVRVDPPQGGWSAVLRVPTVVDEETLALELLVRDGVAVFPGYFFDFPSEGWLVVSLLPPAELFAEGIRRLLATVERSLG